MKINKKISPRSDPGALSCVVKLLNKLFSKKALQDLAKAVKSNDTVDRVKVTITLKKPKTSKAKTKDDK